MHYHGNSVVLRGRKFIVNYPQIIIFVISHLIPSGASTCVHLLPIGRPLDDPSCRGIKNEDFYNWYSRCANDTSWVLLVLVVHSVSQPRFILMCNSGARTEFLLLLLDRWRKLITWLRPHSVPTGQ